MIKIHNGYQDIEVELLSYTKDIDQIAIRMCGLTYHHKDNFNNKQKTVDFIINKLIENKTSPKILEAAHCVFVFKNISRVNLARLTRDQVGAINSESGAVPHHDIETGTFTDKYKKQVSTIKPLSILHNKELNSKFDEIVNLINDFRLSIETEGLIWAPDMRYLFPQGETISIAMEYNSRQLAAACNKRILNAVGDEDNFTMRKAILALKNKVESDYTNNDLSELSYKLWNKIITNAIPKVQFVDELLGDQLCIGMKTRGDNPEKAIYNKYDCSLFYELIKAYVLQPELLLLEGEREMVRNWINNDRKAYEVFKFYSMPQEKAVVKKNKFFVIIQHYKNCIDKYVASRPMSTSDWRSIHLDDARKFSSKEEAEVFIDTKYKYKDNSNFTIKEVN